MHRGDIMAYQNYLLAYARSQGPFDSLTRLTQNPILQAVFNLLSFPIVLLQLVTTFILGILATVTFGLALLPLNLVWLLFLGGLLGSSWLWIRAPLSRPILLIPGILWSNVSRWFASLVPEMGDWEARAMKQALCESWPHSYHIIRMSNDLADE